MSLVAMVLPLAGLGTAMFWMARVEAKLLDDLDGTARVHGPDPS